MLDTYGIVVTAFLVKDKANQVKFFEETFLMANVSSKVVHGMPCLTLSSGNIDFLGFELQWRTYNTEEVLPTTRRVKLVDKKKFAAAMLDPEYETYIIHVESSQFQWVAQLFPAWYPSFEETSDNGHDC